jgi:hypothetical protein
MKRGSARAPFDIINSGAHWRMRAEEIRTLADDTEEATARAMMLRIAADYDRLAKCGGPQPGRRELRPSKRVGEPGQDQRRLKYLPRGRIHNRLRSIPACAVRPDCDNLVGRKTDSDDVATTIPTEPRRILEGR